MKIHALIENTPFGPEFQYEHGLSLYIETEDADILFDTGADGRFAENAEKLGLDLRKTDFAFLSHGHYDHGGGLSRFMELNSHAPVYISPAAFGDYYNASGKYIGLDRALEGNPRFRVLSEFKKLGSAELHPCFDDLKYPVDPAGLQEKKSGVLRPDAFRHEQYLLINEGGRRVLFSGCSHRGILNIAEHFRPDVLIGGFHFMKQDVSCGRNAVLDAAAEKLLSLDCMYYTCHCTGYPQYLYLKERMGERLGYLSSGETIVL